MKFTREQYIEYMHAEDAPRPMFSELLGPLIGLPDEWKAQGATEAELKLTAFDFDYVPFHCIGNTSFISDQKTVVTEETDEYRIERDALGRTLKLCKDAATLPLPLDYPVTDMDSWLKLKPLFEDHADRVTDEEIQKAMALREEGELSLLLMTGGFDFARQLMGEEGSCLCYYEDPELMQDMLDTACDTACKVIKRISAHFPIDQIAIHEDFAGKSGPLVGPNQVKEFIAPYFQAVSDLARENGTTLISVDSDGDIRPVMQPLLDCGINLLLPMEPAAGMDMVEMRKQYGSQLKIKGGIDKHVLRKSKDEIRKELEYKLQPSMRTGGVVFGLDHHIPNGTPLENYRFYVDTAREILGMPPRDENTTGWGRMLF